MNNGIKSAARLRSYMTSLAAYRTVTVADGAVTPATPPDISLLDLSTSPIGLNTVQVFVEPTAGDTPTLQAWVVIDDVWYLFDTTSPASNLIWTLTDVPAAELAIVVTVSAGAVVLKASLSN